jgi:hypothetical protein
MRQIGQCLRIGRDFIKEFPPCAAFSYRSPQRCESTRPCKRYDYESVAKGIEDIDRVLPVALNRFDVLLTESAVRDRLAVIVNLKRLGFPRSLCHCSLIRLLFQHRTPVSLQQHP